MISVGAVDDVTAQGDLARVLERFRGDPRAALGLDATTDAAAARRAFMALCKVYHPAKFARYDRAGHGRWCRSATLPWR